MYYHNAKTFNAPAVVATFSDASRPLSRFAGQNLPGIRSVSAARLQPAPEYVCQLAAGVSGPVLLFNLLDQESSCIPAH